MPARAFPTLRLASAAFLVALLAGALSLWVSGALRAGFSGADEPAHYLNTLVIARYAADALGSNPMAYATEFYLHYPKISIGHWPPGYYGALAPLFLVGAPTPAGAIAINLVLASLASVAAALFAGRLLGTRAGLLAAAACALTPVMLEGSAFFMLDVPLAAVVMAATALWIAHVAAPRPWKVFAFALVAAWAVLIKGNGWLLLFVPPIHLALTGRWRVLASLWPWGAALLAALLVGPWYWLTAGIAADGFNYEPGPAYAAQALAYNLRALAANLTPVGLALAGWGLWRGRRARDADAWNILAGLAALTAATLLLQSLVPVDLDARYVAPAIPPIVVLAICGTYDLARRAHRPVLAIAAALILAAPGVAHLGLRAAKVDLRLDQVAAAVSPGEAWLIDGTSGAEGALAAEMAVRDRHARNYMIRASSLLARSDFMGDRYALATDDPAAVLAQVGDLGVSGIAVVRLEGRSAFPHSTLLRRALTAPGSGWRRAGVLPHGGRPGTTEIFRPRARAAPNVEAIRALGVPAKAKGLTPAT